jgi:hypothetical protein
LTLGQRFCHQGLLSRGRSQPFLPRCQNREIGAVRYTVRHAKTTRPSSDHQTGTQGSQGQRWATAPSRPGTREIGTHWPSRRQNIGSGTEADCGGTAEAVGEVALGEEEVIKSAPSHRKAPVPCVNLHRSRSMRFRPCVPTTVHPISRAEQKDEHDKDQ